MTKAKKPIKKTLMLYMLEADIESFTQLAKETGIDYQRLNRRIADPHSLTVFEILALDNTLHFSDEDLLKLIKG